LAKLKNYQSLSFQDLGVSFVGLNTLKAGSPLESLAARQAAAYALDIPAILKAGGLRGDQASQLVPPAIPGYSPAIHDTPYNPAKAKALLASVKDASVPLTLSYPAGDASQVTEIAKELNAVGFNVTTSEQPDINSLINLALSGKTDMYYATYTSDILDGLDIINSIVVGNANYDNASVSKLADQASSTLDPATRIGLLQKIALQVAADAPDIPLYTQTQTYALGKPSYHLQVDIPSTDAGVYFWQAYQQ
jgi:ABC-type transport system substrate-binding protein